MKNFKDYLAENAKSYVYYIKFATRPTDDQIGLIETWLKKYDLKELTSPILIEDNHKDFIDVKDRAVHSMMIKIGLPISNYIMLQDLKTASGISEKVMVVRNEFEPIERYAQFDAWERKTNAAEEENGNIAGNRLSTDREYTAAEQPPKMDLFGDEYNKKLLSYLAGVESERPTMNIDPPAPLFSWIQMEDAESREPAQDTADFNAGIDTPKPVIGGKISDVPIDDKWLTSAGTMSDDTIPAVKFYKNPTTGKTKQVIKPVEKK